MFVVHSYLAPPQSVPARANLTPSSLRETAAMVVVVGVLYLNIGTVVNILTQVKRSL